MTNKAHGVLWYPTQAKVRLEWGTQPWLPVRQAGLGHEICGIEVGAGLVKVNIVKKNICVKRKFSRP
jgi:hypothetical protein